MSLAYVILNLDPVLAQLGLLAVHWYGLAYVVAIALGLAVVWRWARHVGMPEDYLWPLALWTAAAGLVGGRLYFVLQQPNLVSGYLARPLNIVAVWNGGMAFFGAIFAAAATLFLLAPRYGLNRWLALDGGALFAAVGQIVGRVGNLVNGDILGQALASGPISVPAGVCAHAPCIAVVADPRVAPWAIVYLNPHSFAPLGVPFQPAPAFEMLANLGALAILWPLRDRVPRRWPGLFFTLYLALYAVGQFIVFFLRGSEPITPFLGVSVLKQAQWTAVFTFLAALALAALVRFISGPGHLGAKLTLSGAGGVTPGRALSQSGPLVREARRKHGLAEEQARLVAPPAAEPAGARAEKPPWTPSQTEPGQLRNVFAVVPPRGAREPDQEA